MTTRDWTLVALGAAAALLAACSSAPAPAELSPQPVTPAATPQAAVTAAPVADLAAARRDSLAEAARADSAARVAADVARADSVRAEVERGEAGADAAVAESGLTAADDSVLVARIHFDFDRSDIRADARATLDEKLRLLTRYPHIRVEIAGNADERGSDEYNLALGLRRAASARRYLVEFGIAPARISIVSFGEERPLDPGHDEEAWAVNRRADFETQPPR